MCAISAGVGPNVACSAKRTMSGGKLAYKAVDWARPMSTHAHSRMDTPPTTADRLWLTMGDDETLTVPPRAGCRCDVHSAYRPRARSRPAPPLIASAAALSLAD